MEAVLNDSTRKQNGRKRSYGGSKIELLLEKAERSELSIAPVPDQGTLAKHTEELIYDGPDALVRATREAAKLSKLFGEEFEEKWFLETKWLRKLRTDNRGRACVKYALRWRPVYLATLALSNSHSIAAKAASVSRRTVEYHRVADEDFQAQCDEAKSYAVQLLQDVCMRRCIEGDLEPVYWQGIKIGHVRKFDSRLQIVMLRAHLPQTFKTPGNNVSVSVDNRKVIVWTPEIEKDVQRRRLEAQKRAAEIDAADNRSDENPISIAELIRGH